MIYFAYFSFSLIHLELKRQIRLYALVVPLKTIPGPYHNHTMVRVWFSREPREPHLLRRPIPLYRRPIPLYLIPGVPPPRVITAVSLIFIHIHFHITVGTLFFFPMNSLAVM